MGQALVCPHRRAPLSVYQDTAQVPQPTNVACRNPALLEAAAGRARALLGPVQVPITRELARVPVPSNAAWHRRPVPI